MKFENRAISTTITVSYILEIPEDTDLLSPIRAHVPSLNIKIEDVDENIVLSRLIRKIREELEDYAG